MGLNSLGLGFSFGGKDAGMGKQVSDQTKGLSLMGQAVDTLNKILSVNRLSAFLDSIALSRLGDIADGISNIATAGRNLTTSFEATLTTSNKTGRAMAANFGYTAKEMGKFSSQATSLSINLNTSVEQAGKAAYAWKEGSTELQLLGVDSAETAVKMAEVFNVDPSKLVFQLKEMKSSLGLTDDELKKVVSSTVAWGQQSGDVSKAMETLPGQIASMREHAHSLGKTLSGGEVAAYAESTNQAAQLMYMFTNNAETAQAAAQDLGKRLVGAGKDFSSMFAGTQTELPAFFEKLAVSGVDIKEQFKLMQGGPVGFIKGMSTMVKKAGGFANMTSDQMNFIKKHMEEALGPEMATQMFTLFEKGGDAVEEFAKKLPVASDNLGDLSKAAHRTGRTLADQMDLQESMFVARLRTSSTAGATFVKETGKAYKEWGDKLLVLSKEKGPLGSITRKMIEMHQVGALALIPDTLRPMAGVLGSIAKESAPLVGMMGSLGFRMSMLLSPITLIVLALGGLVYWFMQARKEGKKTLSFSDTLKKMWGQVGVFFSETLPKYLKIALKKIAEFGSYLAKVVPPLILRFAKFVEKNYPKVVAALKGMFIAFFEKVLPFLGTEVPKLMGKLGELIRKWAPVAVKGLLTAYVWVYKEIANGILWLGKKLWEYLPTILDTLVSLVKGALGLVRDIILGVLDGIRAYLVEAFPEYADIINNVFLFISDMFNDVVQVLGDLLGFVADSWKTVIGFINDEIANGGESFKAFGRVVSEMFWGLWDDVKAVFSAIGEIITAAVDIWAAPFKMIDGWADKLFRHSIDTEMNVSFDKAAKHAGKFSKDVSSSLTSAVAPLGGIAGSAGAGKGAKPLPPSIRKPMVSSGDAQASLLGAVNMPQWYARYEALFNARMAALEAALGGAGGGTGKAGRSASTSKIRGIAGDDGMSHATSMDINGLPTRGG